MSKFAIEAAGPAMLTAVAQNPTPNPNEMIVQVLTAVLTGFIFPLVLEGVKKIKWFKKGGNNNEG